MTSKEGSEGLGETNSFEDIYQNAKKNYDSGVIALKINTKLSRKDKIKKLKELSETYGKELKSIYDLKQQRRLKIPYDDRDVKDFQSNNFSYFKFQVKQDRMDELSFEDYRYANKVLKKYDTKQIEKYIKVLSEESKRKNLVNYIYHLKRKQRDFEMEKLRKTVTNKYKSFVSFCESIFFPSIDFSKGEYPWKSQMRALEKPTASAEKANFFINDSSSAYPVLFQTTIHVIFQLRTTYEFINPKLESMYDMRHTYDTMLILNRMASAVNLTGYDTRSNISYLIVEEVNKYDDVFNDSIEFTTTYANLEDYMEFELFKNFKKLENLPFDESQPSNILYFDHFSDVLFYCMVNEILLIKFFYTFSKLNKTTDMVKFSQEYQNKSASILQRLPGLFTVLLLISAPSIPDYVYKLNGLVKKTAYVKNKRSFMEITRAISRSMAFFLFSLLRNYKHGNIDSSVFDKVSKHETLLGNYYFLKTNFFVT